MIGIGGIEDGVFEEVVVSGFEDGVLLDVEAIGLYVMEKSSPKHLWLVRSLNILTGYLVE